MAETKFNISLVMTGKDHEILRILLNTGFVKNNIEKVK